MLCWDSFLCSVVWLMFNVVVVWFWLFLWNVIILCSSGFFILWIISVCSFLVYLVLLMLVR